MLIWRLTIMQLDLHRKYIGRVHVHFFVSTCQRRFKITILPLISECELISQHLPHISLLRFPI